MDNEIYAHRPSLFPPSGLSKYDLPELAALIAPRPVLLLNAVDQVHGRVDLEHVAQIYSSTSRLFDLVGAARAFRMQHAASAQEIVESYRKHLF